MGVFTQVASKFGALDRESLCALVFAGQEPQPLLVLGKRKRRTESEDALGVEAIRERKLSFSEVSQPGDKKKTPSKPVKTGKAAEGVKQPSTAGTEDLEKPEKSKKEADKEGSSRSLSPGKQEKAKAKSSGGTQTMFPSAAGGGSSSSAAATSSQTQSSVALKTFSSIIKKKHRHKDKNKDKSKLKRLGSKHKHKHHKKHKVKGKLGATRNKDRDSKQSKKDSGKSEGKVTGSAQADSSTTPGKKSKASKPESPFSIVPHSSSPGSSDANSKANGDSKKSELTVRIRSNSGDFTHNPYEFRSEDEDSSTGTSTTTQSTSHSESAAEADTSTNTARQKDEEKKTEEEQEENTKEEPEEVKTTPAKKAKTTPSSTSKTPSKKRRERTSSSDNKSKIAGEKSNRFCIWFKKKTTSNKCKFSLFPLFKSNEYIPPE